MSQVSGKGSLPNGWIVKISSKFPDRIYYFNTITGNSTWECPELVHRRLSDGKAVKESKGKPTQKRYSDGQTNIVGRHSASGSLTPEEISSGNMQKNISKKRSLDRDTPTSSRSVHSPKEFVSFYKPPIVKIPGQNKLKEKPSSKTVTPTNSRILSQEEFFSFNKPSTANVSLRIPTAIVAPVIAGEEKTSTHVGNSSQALNAKKKRKRKKKKSKQIGYMLPRAVAMPTTTKRAQQMPKNEHKRLRTSPPIREGSVTDNKTPSFNASTSNEIGSTDSDMELEFGASLNATPSTSREATESERNDKWIWAEVEMLDVSADLTSLDDIVPSRDPNQLNSYYIVVDTNVLIHDIVHIEEIRETPLQGCGPPHIVIPWVVFQELDRLKTYNDGPAKLAQNAVRYLHKILKSKNPRFHGQSGEEAHKLKREYHESNDDKIIDLCLSLRKKMAPEKVILMTNDKNLANKAMTYEVIVHDWISLLKDIKPDIPIQAVVSKKKQKKKCKDELVPAVMTKERQRLEKERSGYEEDIKSLIAEAKQMLKDTLDPFLVTEMQKVYGAAWLRFEIDRRLLRAILAAYIKFWPTVFYIHFNNKLKNSFELLHQKATSPEGFNGSLEDLLLVFHAIEDIFRAIVKVQPNMSSTISNFYSLQENFTHIFSICSNVDSSICDMDRTIKTSEENLAFEVLNHNWNVINEICGMVMDYYGVQHTFEYLKPQSIPSDSEYRRVVSDLYPALLHLKTHMKKVIEHVMNSTPSKPTFTRFVGGLKELIPSLKIQVSDRSNKQSVIPNMNHLTTKAMEQFCRKPENRQKIECGYQQLEHFCNKLNEAIQTMISFKKNRPSTS